MNESTYKILIFIKKNPKLSRVEIANKFTTTPNNITNIKRRYRDLLEKDITNIKYQPSNNRRNPNPSKRNVDNVQVRHKDYFRDLNFKYSGVHASIENKTATLRFCLLVLTGKSISLTKSEYVKEIRTALENFK